MRHLPLTDPGTPDLRSPGRFLIWVARGQRRLLLWAVLWGTLWMGAQALIPGALGAGIQAVADTDSGGVVRWSLIVLGLGLVAAASGLLRHRLAVSNWITAASRVQMLVIRQAGRLGADLSRQVATGEVVAASANDVERIGNLFDVVARFVGAVIAFVGVAAILLTANVQLGLVVVVGAPVLALAVGPLVRPLERRESTQRARLGEASELSADIVAGLRVLRGVGGEELFLDRFHEASQRVLTAAVHTARVRSLLDALQVLLPGLYVVTVTGLGVQLAAAGTISVGQLVAFYGYTAFLVLPLRTITETAQRWTAARVATIRVITVLSLDRLVHEGDGAASEPPPGPLVDPESGLVVTPGQMLAVVSGDPRLADALAQRLGRFAEGEVTLNDVPLAELPIPVVRRRILVQDKDPVILSGTAGDLFDVPGSGRIAVNTALTAASAQDVVEALPSGLATELPERGRSLSGGQRQRLALARSLVADPEILVLDEPTSAVDAHTEARIGERLRAAREGRTTVVFTTSPLLLEHVDDVALLVDGRVVARGTHRELLQTEPRYRDVVERGGA